MQKLLSKDGAIRIGSLKSKDGHFRSRANESLTLLLKTHFPNSIVLDPSDIKTDDAVTNLLYLVDETKQGLTDDRLIWAINSFKPFKSPGSDGIFPALLQHGVESLLPHLHKLFSSSLALGCVPRSWSGTNVVFIPKPGKSTYADPKSLDRKSVV